MSSHRRRGSPGRAALTVALATAGAVVVLAAGAALPAPPVGSGDELQRWFDTHGAPGAAMAMVRVAAVVLAGWLAVATGVSVVAELRPTDRLRRVAAGVAPRTLRRAVALGLGSAVAVGPVAGSPATADPLEPPPPHEVPEAAGGIAILRPVGPTTDHDGGDHDDDDGAGDPEATAPPAPAPDPREATTADHWRVEPGDSCWRIAAEVLAEAWGRPATDAEVARYWHDLVEANRDRFRTGDPDLIYPGQDLVVPAPPTPASGG